MNGIFFKATVCSLEQGCVGHGSRGEGIIEEDVGSVLSSSPKGMATGLRGLGYSPPPGGGVQELPILFIRISQ